MMLAFAMTNAHTVWWPLRQTDYEQDSWHHSWILIIGLQITQKRSQTPTDYGDSRRVRKSREIELTDENNGNVQSVCHSASD